MLNPVEPILLEIMDVIAARFDKQAVLRGGMVLRVLGCERFTNDVDYVFRPFTSKKDIVDSVIETLKTLPDVSVSASMNSKCVRILVTRNDQVAQVEIKVAKEVKIEILSNRELIQGYPLPVRLLPVLDYRIAMADKMAAWNERRLIRDVYDIWFFSRMGIKPDPERLKNRLKKPSYSKLVKEESYFPKGKKPEEFWNFFRSEVEKITDKQIKNELSGILPENAWVGLGMKFRAEFSAKF